MSYSSPSDVRQALAPGITDPTQPGPPGTAASMTDAELNDAIGEADSRIDAMLGSRYAMPLTSNQGGQPVAIINIMSRDMAAYFATLRWRRNKDLTPNDPVQLRYTDISGFLNRVATGQASLNLDVQAAGNPDDMGQAGAPINPYDGALFGQGQDYDLRQPTFGWDQWVQERWL